jgi:hypothetical protein
MSPKKTAAAPSRRSRRIVRRPSAFGLAESLPEDLDSESAAKRILAHAFASKAMPSLTKPKVDDEESDFRSLGVETVPLTGTVIVKFRQQIRALFATCGFRHQRVSPTLGAGMCRGSSADFASLSRRSAPDLYFYGVLS